MFEVADAVTGTIAGFLGISVYLSTGDSHPHAVYGRDVDSYKPLVSSPVPVTDIAMISGVLNGSPQEVNGNSSNIFYGWLNETAINPPATVNEAAARIEEITGIRRGLTQVRKFLDSLGLRPRKIGMIPAKADLEEQDRFKK